MEKIKIGDACDILNGYAFKSDEYVNEGIRIIRIANVQKGYIEDDAPAFYPMNSIGLNKYMLKEDDLLMSLTGNVGRVALLQKEMLPAALNQRVACLRLKTDKLIKRYLFHILNSNFFERQCIQASKGVAQKNMSTEWLKDYEIPLYSIEKQLEIIEVLDKTRNVISLRKDELLALDNLIKVRFVELFGNPIKNEKHWEIFKLRDCLKCIDNGKSFTCDVQARTGEHPAILKLSAVTYGDYRQEENKALLDEKQFVDSAEVHSGDLLFTRKNTPELVGMAAYVYNTPAHLMMPDLIFRLVPNERMNAIFLWKLINNREFRSVIQSIAGGSAKSMSNISKERLSNISVICPPIEFQEQFADFVCAIDKSKVVVFNPIYYYNK